MSEIMINPSLSKQRSKVKVCFFSSMHPPFDKRVFDKEAVFMARAGYQVTHLCWGKEESQIRENVTVDIQPRAGGFKGRIKSLIDFYKRGKKIDADIYHCNEVDSWFIGLLLKLFCDKKVIFDVHEHYPANFAEIHFPKLIQPLIKLIVRMVLAILTPFTDHLIFAKKSVAPDFPCSSHKSTFVYNVISADHKDVTKENVSEDIKNLYNGKLTAVHTGLFNKARGWPQVLEAMSLMTNKDFRVLYIGTLNDNSEQEFKNAIKTYGLEDRIIQYDWMPFVEAYQHVVCCQIGLLTFQPVRSNYKFAYPHKLFDYMLAGLPVIAPDFAWEVNEIVTETNCGLMVDTTSAIEMAASLDRLIDDVALSGRLGQNGRKAVLETYNWEHEIAKLLFVYDNMNNISQ